MKTINITLVRHGEPKQLGVLLGRTDIELSELGVQQLTDGVANLEFDRLITSPLKRCSLLAQEIALQRNVKLEVNHDIKEMDFGDWDGLSYEDLWLEKPSVGDFWQNPTKVTPPNGETLLNFQTRVNNWWQTLICEDKGDVVVITHAGVIKQVLVHLFSDEEYLLVPNKVKINYAAVIKIEIKLDDGPSEHLNQTPKAWPMLVF